MPKKVYLLSDQVIHWNIMPGVGRKNVFMEFWGNRSVRRLMDLIGSHVNSLDKPFGWELLDNGMDIQEGKALNPAVGAYNHVFAAWDQFTEDRAKVWRIDEITHVGQVGEVVEQRPVFDALDLADCVMIQDWGMKIGEMAFPDLADHLGEK